MGLCEGVQGGFAGGREAMIDVRELRIGNWINLIDNNKDREYVTWVDIEMLNDIHYSNYRADGIPLTEEILLKAGFSEGLQNFSGAYYKDMPEYSVMIVSIGEGYNVKLSLPGINGLMTVSRGIQYLHQMQNIFYALTRTELAIDL